MKKKQPWKEQSRSRRIVTVILIAVSLVLVTTAERDLHRRAQAELRGNRLLWQLLSLNATGAIAYLRWGRRPGFGS